MPVIGVGIDVVDIDRFMQSLERTPQLRDRLFTDAEATRPPASLAARFAAKEAMAKALGAPVGMAWHDAEIVSEDTGRPRFEIRGTVAARADGLNSYFYYTGDPDHVAEQLAAYRALTPADVQQAAARYLSDRNRVVISIVPAGSTGLAATEEG